MSLTCISISLLSVLLSKCCLIQVQSQNTQFRLTSKQYHFLAVPSLLSSVIKKHMIPMDSLPSSTLSQVLDQTNVIMRNKFEVEQKMKHMIEEGPHKLQVITDFDSTLTKSHVNGTPTTHSIDVLNSVESLSKEFKAGCDELFEKYNDLVYHSKLMEEEKQEVLAKWWAGYVSLLAKESVTLQDIQSTTERINTPLRDGCEEMLKLLSSHAVPVVVVTAGVADVVSHTLRDFDLRVVGNFIDISDKGNVSGFKEPYISVYNKHKISLPVESTRHNVVLMGDSLGDCYMADNILNSNVILKIGFCDKTDEASLDNYRCKYDIVLTQDQTMNVPVTLLKHILFPF